MKDISKSTGPSDVNDRYTRLPLFARILGYAMVSILLGVLIYHLGHNIGAFIGGGLNQ